MRCIASLKIKSFVVELEEMFLSVALVDLSVLLSNNESRSSFARKNLWIVSL